MSKLKFSVKKLLLAGGLGTSRQSRPVANLQLPPVLPSSGKVLEFIGTQGVGKSTLYNATCNAMKKRWFFRDDLEGLVRASEDGCKSDAWHRSIFLQKLSWLQDQNLDAWQTVTKTRQMSRVIYESLMISSHKFSRGFVLEEGLIKNFPMEVLQLADSAVDDLWRDRALVYLTSKDPGVVVNRFQMRVQQRMSQGAYQHIQSDDEVALRFETDRHLFDQLVETALSAGSKVLVVYADNDFNSVVNEVLEFERSLGLEV